MKLTLLGYVQSILSSLDSDEVNSISDSTESMQVAELVRQTYYNVISRSDLPEHKQLIQLEPSLDITQPVVMIIPDGVNKIEWLKYFNSNVLDNPPTTTPHGLNVDLVAQPNWTTTSATSVLIGTGTKVFTVASTGLNIQTGQGVTVTSAILPANTMSGTVISYVGTTLTLSILTVTGSGTFNSWVLTANAAFNKAVPGYQYVTVLPVKQFLDITNSFNPTESNIGHFTFMDTSNNYPGNFIFYYKTDRQPCYCTILSDNYVIFDSYDSTQDSTLQTNKVMAFGEIIPQWIMTDSFIPDIDERQTALLLNEAKSLAFFELKQTLHAKAEREAKRGWSSIQKDKSKSNKPSYFDQLANFGRNARSQYAGLSYFKSRGWDRP